LGDREREREIGVNATYRLSYFKLGSRDRETSRKTEATAATAAAAERESVAVVQLDAIWRHATSLAATAARNRNRKWSQQVPAREHGSLYAVHAGASVQGRAAGCRQSVARRFPTRTPTDRSMTTT